MNWKINYWTVLFILAVCASAFQQHTIKKMIQQFENCNVQDTCQSLALPPSVGPVAEHMFDTSGIEFKKTKSNNLKISDLNAEGFKMHACELRQIVNFKSQGSDVYANFALLPKGSDPDSFEIHLVFKATNADNQADYFDFSTPCPTCPEDR